MMTIEEAIFAYLTSHEAMVGVVGTRPWLFPDVFPQNQTLPAVAYSLDEERSMLTQTGPSTLRHAWYTFDVWSETGKEAMEVGRQLRAAMDGRRGPMGEMDDVTTQLEVMTRTRDPETLAFNVSLTFQIWYHEATR